MSRWLVTGAGGLLARDLVHALAGRDVVALTRTDLDLTDGEAIENAVGQVRPQIVVNCAAWTAVDAAKEHEDTAFRVNAVGAANLARACGTFSGRLVHLSTDYVLAARTRARTVRIRRSHRARRTAGVRPPASGPYARFSPRTPGSCARHGCMALAARTLSEP
jgi:nucleoside-diphosphate-sugar epimerase